MYNQAFIGKAIGNYRIESFLAQGGFSNVYTARHSIFTERPPVVIKLMRTQLSSQEEHDRFVQEARTLERLKHRSILPILDAGEYQQWPYLITAYAPGGTLQERLNKQARSPLPVKEALYILTAVGQALTYAHQAGVIHRDLKPANILFADDEVLLADFGIAAFSQQAQTVTVDFSGSPAYMAPEQFQGKASRRSDQYALACIAYELFSGQKPFALPDTGNFGVWGYKHTTEPPISIRTLNSSLPATLESVLLKALAKDRAQRFPDVASFIVALETCVTTRPPVTNAHPALVLPRPVPDVANGTQSNPPRSQIVATPVAQAQVHTQAPASLPSTVLASNPPASPETTKGAHIPPVQVADTAPAGSSRFLAFLSYFFFWIGSITVLCLKTNQTRFLRFHAWQSTIFFMLLAILYIPVLSAYSTYSYRLYYYNNSELYYYISLALLWLLIIITIFSWLRGMIQSLRGKTTKQFPVGWIAERLVRKKEFYREKAFYIPSGNWSSAQVKWYVRFLAAMSYVCLGIPGLLYMLFRGKNRFLRFHSLQSPFFLYLIAITYFLLILRFTNAATLPISLILLILLILFAPVIVIGWILGIVNSFGGRYYKLPFVGGFVEGRISRNAKLL